MSYAIVIRFEGVTEADYWAVNDNLGINRDGSGDWPEGLRSHAGGPTSDGWVVIEKWESKEAQEAFMAGRLGAAQTRSSTGGAGIAPCPASHLTSTLRARRAAGRRRSSLWVMRQLALRGKCVLRPFGPQPPRH